MNGNTQYRQSLGAIVGSLVGRWPTTTAPNRGVTIKQHAHAWMWRLLLGGLVTVAMSAAAVANAKDKIIHVNCDDGQTLKRALHKADPGDTIRVTGTCTERVTITTDRITLDGGGSAVLDGGGGGPTEFEGVVTIDGAQGVTLAGFTIQNSPGQGILGSSGAAFTGKNITVQDTGNEGILLLNNTSAVLVDSVIQRSGRLGIAVLNTSTAVLRGNISSTDSVSNGIAVQSGSTLEIRGASVRASHNGGNGVDIVDSQAVIFGFPESQGSILTAHSNGADGIFVATGSPSFFGGVGSYTLSASNNGGSGITIELGGTVVSPGGAAKFMIEHNQQNGLNIAGGGSALLIGGLTVQNNQTGLLADGASTLTLVSVPPNPSAITNNGTDVALKFGTRATFAGVTIGTIVCDATVLSRGSTVCPPSP